MPVTLGSKNIGDIVKIKENGVPVEFIVIQKGVPNSYDASCDGVWVLRNRVIMAGIQEAAGIVNYEASAARAWLENTYFSMFDGVLRASAKYAALPYTFWHGRNSCETRTTANHCFLLTGRETGYIDNSTDQLKNDAGTRLAYFPFTASFPGETLPSCPQRIAYDDSGKAQLWRLRSSDVWDSPDNISFWTISPNNGHPFRDFYSLIQRRGMRPTMILDYNMVVDDSGMVVTNTAPSTPASISVPGNIRGGSTVTVSWTGSTDAENNLEGYKLERSTNGGASWSQVYQGVGTSAASNVAYGTGTVMYRVKAYDSMGYESGYRTSGNVTVINNTPPTVPQGITVPAYVRGGGTVTVSWTAATDAQNNLAGYELERSTNGGAWAQVYRGGALSHTDSITRGWQTVAYRVRAYDAYSEYSGYATSQARVVDNNEAPYVSCAFPSGSSIGTKSEGFTVAYTVNDSDNRTGDVTAVESLDGVQGKSHVPVLGQECLYRLEGEGFMCLPNGQHSIGITVNDKKASSSYTLLFEKLVTSASVTPEAPMEADDMITACAVSVSGQIPADAQLRVLVTNNAKDASPAWEDCTNAVKNGVNHVFSNKEAVQGPAFSFRVTVSRGESGEGGYITSVQGGFQ